MTKQRESIDSADIVDSVAKALNVSTAVLRENSRGDGKQMLALIRAKLMVNQKVK